MNNYQLIIIRFKYTDSFVCFWPIFFEVDYSNNNVDRSRDFYQSAINDLTGTPEIKDVSLLLNQITDLNEAHKVFNDLLTTNNANVSIKYLELLHQIQLVGTPSYDYEASSDYKTIYFLEKKFPVRVRKLNEYVPLNDLQLPLLSVTEHVNK